MTVGIGATDEVAERIDEVFIMSGLTIILTRLGGVTVVGSRVEDAKRR